MLYPSSDNKKFKMNVSIINLVDSIKYFVFSCINKINNIDSFVDMIEKSFHF